MKNITNKDFIIFILVLILVGLVIYDLKGGLFKNDSDFVGLENSFNKLNKDIEFYKYISVYKSLLSDDKLKIVDDRVDKISKETEEENSKVQNMLVLALINEVMKETGAEKIILELRDKVSNLLLDSKIDKDTLFSKNTECAKLTSNIKDELLKKFKSTSTIKEKEELNFMFYSPTLNSCVYTTNYEYDYSNYSLSKSEYYTKSSFRVYDVSSNKQLGDYPSYFYKYPYLSEEEANTAVKNGQKDYKKFILENSGYNAKLLKDVNY